MTDDNTLLQTEVELPESLEGADFGLREQDAIDFEELASFGLPAIIDYGADSCIPCRSIFDGHSGGESSPHPVLHRC